MASRSRVRPAAASLQILSPPPSRSPKSAPTAYWPTPSTATRARLSSPPRAAEITSTAQASGITRTPSATPSPIPIPTTTTKPASTATPLAAAWAARSLFPIFITDTTRASSSATYEGWRHPAQKTLFEVVPSTLMKQGDFSKYVEPDGKAGTHLPVCIDPYTGATTARRSPRPHQPDRTQHAQAVLSRSEHRRSYRLHRQRRRQLAANVDASGHSNQFDVRGDQYFGSNQKFLLWGNFTWKNFPISNPESPARPLLISTISQNRAMKVDTNWSIKPNLINEGGFGFTRYTIWAERQLQRLGWTNWSRAGRDCRTCFTTAFRRWTSTTSRALNADRLTSLQQVVHLRLQRYADLEQGQPHLQIRRAISSILRPSRPLASTAPTTTAPTSSTTGNGSQACSPVSTLPTSSSAFPT